MPIRHKKRKCDILQLSNETLSLWAKKENRNGQELWLPLIVHLIDTEKVINWLYHHWFNDAQRRLLQSSMDETDIEKLVKFLGFFHDFGKATPAFQTKPSYSHDTELDEQLIEQLLRSGFQGLNDFRPASRSKSPHALAGEALLENAGLNESIGAIIGGHHGKPASYAPDRFPNDQIVQFTSNYFQSDQNSNLQKNWKKSQQELINYGLSLVGYTTLNEIPIVTQPQAVLLTGLLIMADWFASSEFLNNEIDKPLFPLIYLNQTFNDLNMEKRFERAINTWNITGHWHAKPIYDVDNHYEKRWSFKPRVVQHLISEKIKEIVDPGIIIVEAGMGIGKTEIAMTAVEQLSSIVGTTGLFMGLPTQATTNAMFSRIDNWVTDLAKEQAENLPIKLMHGKAQFNSKYCQLPNAENINSHNAVVVNSWFSGKKSILSDFVIGTIDQLLLMGLKQKHLFLRHLGLSGKVVIIDEVHSYDVYSSSYLKKALQWLGAYHVPVIALSATLTMDKRTELVKAYAKGKYGRRWSSDPNEWQCNQAYPLLTYLDGNQVKQFDHFPKVKEPTIIKVTRLKCNDTEIIDKVLTSISDGGIAGIVVNTVKRAQQLFKLVPKGIPCFLLHSSFLAPDREKLEEKLQKCIGKHAKRPRKMIVIGTQVLEQSLDIDFDVLFTDIAPIDLILQRIGRLQRHKIKRPKSLTAPQVYIMGIDALGDYGDANEAIYEKYWLMKTDYFLPDKIILPNDISKLVQKVYDPNTDSGIPQIKEARHQKDVAIKKEKRKARAFQINAPDLQETIHGWLDRDQEINLSEASAEAAVRDIKESIEVILVKHTTSGDFLINGNPLEEAKAAEIAQQLIRLPNAITPNIDTAIEKLEQITTRYYSGWQESPWLRGMIALPLDNHLQATFNGWRISYSPELGLTYEKDDINGR